MKIITFLNEKGGVGKTTLTAHVGAGLALRGARVLLLDADPQANLTRTLGLAKEPALYNLLVRNVSWKGNIKRVADEVYVPKGSVCNRLSAVPGNIETRLIPMAISDDRLFYRRLMELHKMFDVVLCDTSPTPSLFHASVIAGSHMIVVPTELEPYSAFEGLAASLLHAGELHNKAMSKGADMANVIGIVPVKYREGTVTHNTILNKLRKQHGDALVWSPIHLSIIFADVVLKQKLLYAIGESEALAQVDAITEKVVQHLAGGVE